ncbi:EpsG family protein [Idiomarina abyssalis]|uniref:EpsG family protein n=1 Tax=Idiomarina abyssalis TaxID=86102 RepID=A0A8I1KGN5_9GAMM|nr:EpsG family protein [Idiomarina abyssalis]MBJ7265761.1 EpsG family protein [Idiomarina abyssalis]MBJ7274014.1 EpsG family protein [Idiomarina abyssalis]MBJ7314880.1 EpsG family protein [Idiomarina abyssalis]
MSKRYKISISHLSFLVKALISVIYGYSLTLIPHSFFKDRESYRYYIENAELYIDNLKDNLFLFLSEPVFLVFNYFLSRSLNWDGVIDFYVFFIAFSFCYLTLAFSKNAFLSVFALLLLLTWPSLWSLQLGALRQGLAVAFVAWSLYFLGNTKKFLLAVFFSGLIHISGFLVAFVLLADRVLLKLPPSKALSYRAAVFFICSLVMAFLIGVFLSALPIKQAHYGEVSANVGGGLFVIYSLVLLSVLFNRFKHKEIDKFGSIMVLGFSSYLGLYFFSPIAGRYIDSFLLISLFFLIKSFTYRNLFLISFLSLINAYLFFNGAGETIMTVHMEEIFDLW